MTAFFQYEPVNLPGWGQYSLPTGFAALPQIIQEKVLGYLGKRRGRKGFRVHMKASSSADKCERWGIMTLILVKRVRIREEIQRRKGVFFRWSIFGSYAVQCARAAGVVSRRRHIVHHLHNHIRDVGLAGFGVGPLLDEKEKDSPKCGGGARFFGFGSSVTMS